MKARVVVVDYGAGNLLSVTRALEHCGAEPRLSSDPGELLAAERLLLPGVGAFADGMSALRERGLIEPIRRFAAGGRPFLGICLGMQMMLEAGEEFGRHEGLGLLGGEVRAIPPTGSDGSPHKIPLIGWNALCETDSRGWAGTVLSGVAPGAYAYFLHSYAAYPKDPAHRLADCVYNGRILCAAVRSGSLFGCQFHPEKSGETGLRILRNFCALK